MKSIINYIKSNKHCLFLLYWPIHFIWYEVLRIVYADVDVWIVQSPLDDKIPFCEWFIIPYVFWYLYIAIVLFYSLKQGKREFMRADMLLIGCMFLPMLFCTFVPNGIDVSLRPDFDLLGRDNIATRLVSLIYEIDFPPRNIMPSMHVSVSWALFFAVMMSESLRGRKLIKAAAGIMSLLITLSTVFIKQHSILDVFAGIATAIVIFAVVLIVEKRVIKEK